MSWDLSRVSTAIFSTVQHASSGMFGEIRAPCPIGCYISIYAGQAINMGKSVDDSLTESLLHQFQKKSFDIIYIENSEKIS